MTRDQLRELMTYHPETGEFTWNVSLNSRTKPGKVAGFIRKKYRVIGIDGKLYRAHRLAWLWMTGTWPAEQLDHRDRDGSNNKWSNLREATGVQNMANRAARRDNVLGVKGVYRRKNGAFYARLQIDKKRLSLGCFRSKEDAERAYLIAAKTHCGDFSVA